MPRGEGRSAWRATREAGAALLETQMEAHHCCRQVNRDFPPCGLFDANTKDANLIGVEYIVSERLCDSLPEDEQPATTASPGMRSRWATRS